MECETTIEWRKNETNEEKGKGKIIRRKMKGLKGDQTRGKKSKRNGNGEWTKCVRNRTNRAIGYNQLSRKRRQRREKEKERNKTEKRNKREQIQVNGRAGKGENERMKQPEPLEN